MVGVGGGGGGRSSEPEGGEGQNVQASSHGRGDFSWVLCLGGGAATFLPHYFCIFFSQVTLHYCNCCGTT